MRLSGYRIMWIFCLFDLPTETKKHRRAYTQFKNALEKNGFTMHQFSVYIRHCPSIESMNVHIKRIESILPEEGKISILSVTDTQFGNIKNYWGKEKTKTPEAPQQLGMF